MNIIDKITEWQGIARDRCCGAKETNEIDGELDLVLFAINNLTSNVGNKFTELDALRIRSQASNFMLGDHEYLRILNKEIKL